MAEVVRGAKNRPKSSKRMTDRRFLTRLAGVRKAVFRRGGNPIVITGDDGDDVIRLFIQWCQDWEPRE